MGTSRNSSKSSGSFTNQAGNARRAKARVRDAARSCIDVLESRVLLSTTTISYPNGFSNAFDLSLNPGVGNGATDPQITANGEVQLLDGTTQGMATSVYDFNQQGISTFDTTFKFDFGTVNPDADGFAFVIQNDPAGTSKIGGGGGYLGFGGIQNSVGVKFDFWDGTKPDPNEPTYTASGVFTDGELPADDSNITGVTRQPVTTTPARLHTSVDFSKNADGSATGLDFHTNKTDQFQCHLVYDGTTLTETLTDLTLNKSATQTYTVNIPTTVGQNIAYVGFVAGQGGRFSTPQISSWVYSGTSSAAPVALPAPTLTGSPSLSGAVNLNWAETTTLPVSGYEVDQVNGTTATPIATLGNVTNYQVTGLNPAQSYTFEVKALGDGTNSGNSAFSNTVNVSAAGQAPGFAAWGLQPGQIVVNWQSPYTAPNGFEVDASTDNGATFSKLATFGPQSGRYTLTNLDVTKTYQLRFKALGNGTTTHDSPPSSVISVSGAGANFAPINFPSFPTSTGLVLNGDASITGPTGTPANALELTHSRNGETASAFVGTLAGINTFDTTFQWTFGAQHVGADGFTFTIAQDPGVIGGGGGSLGYQGIQNSVCVAFNCYNGSDTGIATGGGAPKANITSMIPSGIDFHAHWNDTFQAHLTYDGTTLTETVTDQTQIAAGQAATFTATYPVDIPTALGGHTGFIGFTAATGGDNSTQDILNVAYTGTGSLPAAPTPVAVANSSAPGVVDVGWTDTITSGGFEVDQSTDGTTFTPVATNLPASANSYEVTGLTPGSTYIFHVKSKAIGDAPAQTSNDVSITVPTTASGAINHSTGFSGGDTDYQFNLPGGPLTPPPVSASGQLQLTTGGSADVSVFATTPQNVNGFDTSFDFTYGGGSAQPGDGFAFVIQNDPRGVSALGAGGGGLGYGPDTNANGNTGGITNSVAIKFDLYNNQGEGTDSTGLFTNGNAPTLPVRIDQADTSLDMTSSGLQIGPNTQTGVADTYHAHLSYDGAVLHEVVTDVTTNKTFSHDYAINLSQYIKGNTAYVGFTAGTGGAFAEQDINNWTFTHVAVSSQTIVGTAGNDTITIKKDSTDPTKDDVWVNAPTTGAFTTQVSNGQTIVVNGAGGTDTLVFDSSNGNPLPTGGNAVLRLNSGTYTIGGTLPTIDASHIVDVGTSTVNIPYTGTSPLSTIQTALKGGFIKSTDAAASGRKFAVADTDASGKVTLSYRVVGDLNGNGTVGFEDLLSLAQHYNQSGADWSKGDLNYDGTVGFADLLLLAQHYGQTAGATAAAATPLSAQTLAAVVGTATRKPAPKVTVRATARG